MDWKKAVEAIKQRAFDARLNLDTLCKDAKVSRNAFWRWDNGKCRPSVGTLKRLEDRLTVVEQQRDAA